jgi:HAAS domain-containing protein
MRQWGFEMKADRIQTYLRALERKLWLRGLSNPETMAELESHLLESVAGGLRSGLNVEEAQEQALERFGSVKVIANTFEKERMDWMQNLLLGIAALAGLFFAYVDSRPAWDDTGILAGGLLLMSGLLTLLGHRKPWLIALAVGLWIPLHDIYLSHDFLLLLVLLFPLVGAYGGWVIRLGIRKTLHMA